MYCSSSLSSLFCPSSQSYTRPQQFFPKKAKKPWEKIKSKQANNATEKPEKTVAPVKILTASFPYLITPNRDTYITLLKERKVFHIVDGKKKKLSTRTHKIIYNRIKRYGIKDCVCHKIKGYRFLCVYNNADIKEAYIKLNSELIIVADKKENTTYPDKLLKLPYKWQTAWMNLKNDFQAYANLYHTNFKSKYGNREAWLNYRKQSLVSIKYIDVVIEDPVYVKIPSSPYFAIFFQQIYRSNVKRIDTLKALVVTQEGNDLKIIGESSL